MRAWVWDEYACVHSCAVTSSVTRPGQKFVVVPSQLALGHWIGASTTASIAADAASYDGYAPPEMLWKTSYASSVKSMTSATSSSLPVYGPSASCHTTKAGP